MDANLLFAVFLACVYSSDADFAPFITKCKWDDSKCMKESTQAAIPIFAKGIPSLGVEVLDPFIMKSLDASSANLMLLLKDITGTGLKECVPKKIQRDIEKSKLHVKLECSVDVEGQYEMNGKLIFVPIEGKGRAHVVLRKVQILADINLGEIIGSDGVKHWTIKNWTHTYNLKDKSTVELENLFNGNEDLARAARELIANNANDIVLEVGPPIVKAVVSKIVENINSFMSHVPAEELEK